MRWSFHPHTGRLGLRLLRTGKRTTHLPSPRPLLTRSAHRIPALLRLCFLNQIPGGGPPSRLPTRPSVPSYDQTPGPFLASSGPPPELFPKIKKQFLNTPPPIPDRITVDSTDRGVSGLMPINNCAFIGGNSLQLTFVWLGVQLKYDKLPGEMGNIRGLYS